MTAVITAAVYFAVISAYSAAVTVIDKKRAQSRGRRIPERQLFTAAALGGSFVMYAVMRRIRHKTKHKRFMIGLPVIMLLQICAAAAVYIFR